MLLDALFWTALAFIFTHELDAIERHEWRLFAGLNRLPDAVAFRIFTVLHIPLFGLGIWLAASDANGVKAAVDLFLIIHVGLHIAFRRFAAYEFEGFFSWLYIVGAGLFGATHLLFLALG